MPSIILCAEKIIHKHDGDGRRSDNHNAIAEEKKAKHVVHFVEPDAIHDEIEFDKNGAEWKSADEKHRGKRTEISGAWRDLTRDLVCPDWSLDSLAERFS